MSDVDIGVLLAASEDREALLQRQLALLTDLERLADAQVQLALLNEAPPLLAYQVIKDGILLHERSLPERIAFQISRLREYFDFQPRVRVQNDALRRRIREGEFGQGKSGDLRTIEAAERIHKRLKGTARAAGSHGRLAQSDRA
jgi:uncharacterized protein